MANEGFYKAVGAIISVFVLLIWVLEVVLLAWNSASGVYDKFTAKALLAVLSGNTTNATL
jgi:hypothetical protein